VPAAPSAAEVALRPDEVLKAASDPVRLALLAELAREGAAALPVIALAARVGRSADLVAKHLKVLRQARLIVPVKPPSGGDGRQLFHEIPAAYRSRDAAGRELLDFGAVLLRF
jgi:DNA-binding transcriptional ArsR family regulator